ncbi:MAG: response regulator [Desulfuromonadales bacterium]|nr:response regulator [Desulfuromonadales bacterium]
MALTRRPTAIIVDDSAAFRNSLAVLLDRMNIAPLPVALSKEVPELARVTRPELICLDLIVDGKPDLGILRQLRQDPDLAEVPVLIFSNHPERTLHWEALSLGCVDILDKPVKLRRLHKALQRCKLFGGTRRYLRAPFPWPVELIYEGCQSTMQSLTLSERGIFLCCDEPLPKQSDVWVRIPVPSGQTLEVGGQVIYNYLAERDNPASPAGMAIKFDRMTTVDAEQLTELVTNQLIGDILSEQPEPLIHPEPES